MAIKKMYYSVPIKSPCMACESREMGCHSSCGEYRLYRQKMDEEATKERNRKQHTAGGWAFTHKWKG